MGHTLNTDVCICMMEETTSLSGKFVFILCHYPESRDFLAGCHRVDHSLAHNTGEQRFTIKLSKGRHLFDWVNEWVQQPLKQQARGSWRRMKEEELLKETTVGDISEVIFLAILPSDQQSSQQLNLSNKEIQMLITHQAAPSVFSAGVNTGANSIYGHNIPVLLV